MKNMYSKICNNNTYNMNKSIFLYFNFIYGMLIDTEVHA